LSPLSKDRRRENFGGGERSDLGSLSGEKEKEGPSTLGRALEKKERRFMFTPGRVGKKKKKKGGGRKLKKRRKREEKGK